MEHSSNHCDTTLQISFPKSNQDHRLQLVEINGTIFAIVHTTLESTGPINFLCETWNLVLLAPLKSKADISISGMNIVICSDIVSEEGLVNIHASCRLVKFTSPAKNVRETAKQGQFQLDDAPTTLINCFQLFQAITLSCRSSPELLAQAQQKFIASLCLLAEKMEGKKAPLTIHQVLKVWNIPCLPKDPV